MNELLLHLLGDYILQSHWMAERKTHSTWAAFVHATVYALPFLLVGSYWAVLVIWFTHMMIDRFRLARYVIYLKNHIGPPSSWYRWNYCENTGFASHLPPYLTVWLMIICDNALHMIINHLSIKYL